MKHTKSIPYDVRVRAFWTLATLCLALLVIYIYAVNATVHNTLARQTLQNEAANLSTHISEMEYNAITLKNNVSLDLALAHGFQEVTSPIFITRSDGRALSMNTTR